MHALSQALWFAGFLGHFARNPAEVERLTSDLTERSTRQNFASWSPGGDVPRGWARSASGDTAEGILWIENGIALFCCYVSRNSGFEATGSYRAEALVAPEPDKRAAFLPP
jgi:hypothetical protein